MAKEDKLDLLKSDKLGEIEITIPEANNIVQSQFVDSLTTFIENISSKVSHKVLFTNCNIEKEYIDKIQNKKINIKNNNNQKERKECILYKNNNINIIPQNNKTEKSNNSNIQLTNQKDYIHEYFNATIISRANINDLLYLYNKFCKLSPIKEVQSIPLLSLSPNLEVFRNYNQIHNFLIHKDFETQSQFVNNLIKHYRYSLVENNSENIKNLFGYLFQHINDYALIESVKGITECYQLYYSFYPYLLELARDCSETVMFYIYDLLQEKYNKFNKDNKTYPNLDTLIIFQFISKSFYKTTFTFPIISTSWMFMSNILFNCYIKSKKDISKGLFICAYSLEYSEEFQQFYPQPVLNFLHGIIYLATPKHLIPKIELFPPFNQVSNLLILDTNYTNLDVHLDEPFITCDDLIELEINDDFKIRAIANTMILLDKIQDIYQDKNISNLFEPIIKILELNHLENYPKNIQTYSKIFYKNNKILK